MASELETQKKAVVTESKNKNGKVNLSTKVTIVGTDKGPLEKGKEYEVHPIHGETLVKKGFAAKK